RARGQPLPEQGRQGDERAAGRAGEDHRGEHGCEGRDPRRSSRDARAEGTAAPMTDQKKRPAPEDVRTITCIGAGVIGGGWAAYFLARGYPGGAWDPAEDAESRLRHLVGQAWPALVELGLSEGASPDDPWDNLVVEHDLA